MAPSAVVSRPRPGQTWTLRIWRAAALAKVAPFCVALAVFVLVAGAFAVFGTFIASTLHDHDTGVIISLVIGAAGGVTGYFAAWVAQDYFSNG